VQGLAWRGAIPLEGQVRFARINGQFGVVLQDGEEVVTIAFEADAEGRLCGVYMVRNPDKLAHVAR